MKIIYHEKFEDSGYSTDPAAREGRIESIYEEIKNLPDIEFVEPEPAGEDDLELVHTRGHIERVRRGGDLLFEMASLAAGGAIEAGEIAFDGVPAFALIRPPGHHASADSSWGFCYFNNMAIAIQSLRKRGKIEEAFILDFDLHYGDGNVNILGKFQGIRILNPRSGRREDYLSEISKSFEAEEGCDMVGISAGFDEHVEDWGGKLETGDYEEIGSMVKEFSEDKGLGRRFALLEGGYNHDVLGKNVRSFLEGFR